MKKKVVWIAAAVLIAACTALVLGNSTSAKTLSYSKTSERERLGETGVFGGLDVRQKGVLSLLTGTKTLSDIEPEAGKDFMKTTLTYDQGLRTLRGTQRLTAENRTGADLDEIVLRAYMNGWEGCSVQVSGAAVNNESVLVAPDEDDPTVIRIHYPWRAGEAISLDWTVMIKHAKTDGAPVILLPALAMNENGTWRTDIYDDLADPSYAQPFDFVTLLDGVVVARGRMARDAGFAMGDAQREREVSGVRIRTIAQKAGAAKKLLDQTETALKSLSEAGIAYPFDLLIVADGGAGDDLALSGLIVTDAQADKEALLRSITRQIARQTFGVMIENDPWNAPWLSHTLASCAEMLAYRQRKGAAAYEERLYGELELATRITRPAGVTVGAATAHFGSKTEMEQVLCDQGAAHLLGIEQAVGTDAFVSALKTYILESTGKTGSAQALCDALERATGSSWTGYLEDML